MPFEKNDKNINTKGRAKGVPNKTTSEIKTLLLSVFNDNLNEILSKQNELTLNERLALNKTLLPYIIPNVKQESYSNDLDPSSFNW
jgi:hypothetical protein